MSNTLKDSKKIKGKETKKIKKLLSEEMRLGLHDGSNSDSEGVDLPEDLYSLSHYVNKREEMVEQMFTIMSGNSLTKMLPPSLKDMNLDELKAECLIHLLGMSSKRIISILEGREIDSSSESETDSEPSTPQNKTSKKKITTNKFTMKQDGCSDISNDSNDFEKKEESPDLEAELHHKETDTTSVHNDKGDSKVRKSKKRKSLTHDFSKKKKQITVKNSVIVDTNESEASAEAIDDDDNEKAPNVVETQGKTLLEILELEMRAKAIRALLKQGGEERNNHEGNEDKNDKGKKSQLIISKESVSDKNENIRNARKSDKEIGLVTIDLTNEGESSKIKEDQNKTFEIQTSKCENISIDESKDSEISKNLLNDDIGENLPKESKLLEVNSPTETDKTEETTVLIQQAIPKSSWAERWLQSKDVNKVVSTSKMCANIRKRMRNARLAKQNSSFIQSSSTVETDLKKVEGSVTEYQLLNKSQHLDTPEGKTSNEESGLSMDSENDVTQGSVAETETTNFCQGSITDCTLNTRIAEDQPQMDVSCDEK